MFADLPALVMAFFRDDGFVVELFLAMAMYVWWVPRRQRFIVRALIAFVATCVVSSVYVALMPGDVPWYLIIRSVLLYGACFLGLWNSFRVTAGQALFYVTAAVAIQHLSYSCAQLVIAAATSQLMVNDGTMVSSLFYSGTFIVFLAAGWFLFARPLRGRLPSALSNSRVFPLTVGILLCVTVFSCLFDYYTIGVMDGSMTAAYAMFVATRIITCTFLLMVLRETVERETAQRDRDILQSLLAQQKTQLESDKATIDLINMKTHNLKKQLSLLGSSVSDEQMSELHDLANIYDASVRSGNETLDILLTNKSMICEQRGILFDRMVDGHRLGFMSAADIYALFGNILDNATFFPKKKNRTSELEYVA